jgi:hypothetical protein
MTTPDPQDELTMLARARAGLSPTAADALRVRASLDAALAAPGDVTPDASPSGSGLGTGGGWSLRFLATSIAVATVGAGAGGYWMGYRAGAREPGPAVTHAVAKDGAPSPSGASPSGPIAIAETGPPSPAAPVAIGDAAGVRETSRRRPGNMPRTARPEVVASPAESLEQEVRALRAVERALRDDDPRLALAILQQLDRDVPKGKLVEERRATSVIARCAAGDVPFGVNWAEDFASDYPDSVYRGRVEQSCERRGGK